MKISAVYKIVNTVTNECYIGSSKDVMKRWREHKCPSTWKEHPNSPLYQDMKKHGVDNFDFQILCPVMPEYLKQVEQELIEMLQPTYNNRNAKGWDVERLKKARKKAIRMYRQTDKGKEINRKQARKDMRKYNNQLCSYNGETLTLNALSGRFRKTGLEHPTLEAKKYLISEQHN